MAAIRARTIGPVLALALAAALSGARAADAALLSVDILSNSIPGHALPNLNLPRQGGPQGLYILPAYLQVNFSPGNMNWGIELYTDNAPLLDPAVPPNNLYRGLRAPDALDEPVPLYWQVYDYDLNVPATWGTPNSITRTAGELGLYPETLRNWGTVYDRSDAGIPWDEPDELEERLLAEADALGKYPRDDRDPPDSPVYLYLGYDTRAVNGSYAYLADFNLDLFYMPFDFATGCYATPNPVKPMRGEKVFFNFYTNRPDSAIKITIYDPTGYPVATLHDTRYWNVRNSRGHFVEGGLYLYQIETEGHVISGTVVVVK